jgi:hypothetical protein
VPFRPSRVRGEGAVPHRYPGNFVQTSYCCGLRPRRSDTFVPTGLRPQLTLHRPPPRPHAARPHDSRAAHAAFNVRLLKTLRFRSRRSRIHMHPERACIPLRAHEHREAFFSLDADFALRVTLQQPKLLCSSQLGETCPTPPDAVGGVLPRWDRLTAVYRCKHAKAAPKGGPRGLIRGSWSSTLTGRDDRFSLGFCNKGDNPEHRV